MTQRVHPTFHGDGGTLFGIHLKNLLLTLVTLGIYAFWAKANVRQYLYSQTEVAGDRFTYSGTGGELLRGWAKAFGLVFVGGILAAIVTALVNEAVGALVLYGGVGLLIFPLAIIGSRRYRLTRTTWRGIRFSFHGRYGELLGVFIPGLLLTVITLGIYYPFFHANVRRFVLQGTRFGHRHFEFTGEGGDLLGRHLLLYIALPCTLGLYWFWYAAYRHRYYWGHTSFGSARFESTMEGGDLLGFTFVNALLTAVTLGIAYPWVQARTMRFHAERLSVVGMEAFDEAVQDARRADVTGEGLSEMFDWDLAGADFFGL